MSVPTGAVLLGTVALEPNRWATVDATGAPRARADDWLAVVRDAGFDGLEVWERHLADPGERARLVAGHLPVVVLNSYVSFDDPDPKARRAVADLAAALGVGGVKFNVGADPAAEGRYAERVAAWVADLPAGVAALCECHAGISIAEDPVVAARLLAAAGPPDRVQAIVHTHESADHLRARFDVYGDRITHVHVNFLDAATLTVPPLADRRRDLEATVTLLRSLGYAGSWTLEFVEGVLTTDDRPTLLAERAARDVAVLREVLA